MNYSIWFLLFVFLGYFIVTDSSVARLFILTGYQLKIKFEKLKWKLLHLPNNPIVRWRIHQNSLRIAKELQEEFDKKNKEQ